MNSGIMYVKNNCFLNTNSKFVTISGLSKMIVTGFNKHWLLGIVCLLFAQGKTLGQDSTVHDYFNKMRTVSDIDEKIELYYKISYAYNLQGNDSMELKYDRIAINLSKKYHKSQMEAKGYYFIAEKFYMVSENDSASYYARRCIDAYRNKNFKTKYYVAAMNILASTDLDKAKGESALQLIDEQLRVASEIKDSNGISSAYTLLASVYESTKDKHQALKYALKALDIDRAFKNEVNLSQSLTNVGMLYLDLNHAKAALPLLKEALHIASNDYPSVRDKSTAQLYLGKCYLALGQRDSAFMYFHAAGKVIPSLGDPDLSIRMYESNANTCLITGKFDSALINIDAAISLSDRYSLLDLKANGLDVRSDILAKLGRYKEAYEQHLKYVDLNDSLNNSNLRKSIALMRVKYNIINKDQKIARQKVESIFLMIRSILLFSLLVIIFIQYIRQKNTTRVVRKQSQNLNLLLKELHHRVKNNLQIVSSLMSLQAFRIKDEKASQAVRDGQRRIEAMSLIHQKLYTRDNMTEINIQNFIVDLVEGLRDAYDFNDKGFHLQINAIDEQMDVDKAIPLGLIVNELVSNVFKYAYNGVTNPKLSINMQRQENNIILIIADNGVGIDLDKWNARESTFGKEIIQTFVRQLKGTLEVKVDAGTQFTIIVPDKK